MESNERKCFVISPIGKEGSDIRKKADIFLSVVRLVGEGQFLEVKRGEEFSNPPFDINKDILEALRSWDLCIVDLTGLNPNVLFEFGIRYQTGLPFVLCAETGTEIPFDTSFIRTILYDNLEQTNHALTLKEKISKYVQEIQNNGFKLYDKEKKFKDGEIETIISQMQNLNDKSDMITEILLQNHSKTEDDTEEVLKNQPQKTAEDEEKKPKEYPEKKVDDLEGIYKDLSPKETYIMAIAKQDIQTAEAVLDQCLKYDPENKKIYLFLLAGFGSPKGISGSIKLLKEMTKKEYDSSVEDIISYTVAGILKTDPQKITEIDELIMGFLEKVDKPEGKASLLCQKARLVIWQHDYDTAIELLDESVRLNHMNMTSRFYRALANNEKGNDAIAKKDIGELVNSKEYGNNISFLDFAYKVLKKSKEEKDKQLAKKVFTKLKALSPGKANFLSTIEKKNYGLKDVLY